MREALRLPQVAVRRRRCHCPKWAGQARAAGKCTPVAAA